MKVILSSDVPKLGKEGDLIEVSDGYARNYLFPRQLAVVANDSNTKMANKRKEVIQRKADTIKGDAEKLAGQLNGKAVTLRGKTGKNSNKLFGAITAVNIAQAIKEQHGLDVDRRRIVLLDPIKAVGDYNVPLHLHQDVDATITVTVEGEAAQA